MKRAVLNIVVDTLAAAVMLGMIATGIIIRFTLPPGSGRVGPARSPMGRPALLVGTSGRRI